MPYGRPSGGDDQLPPGVAGGAIAVMSAITKHADSLQPRASVAARLRTGEMTAVRAEAMTVAPTNAITAISIVRWDTTALSKPVTYRSDPAPDGVDRTERRDAYASPQDSTRNAPCAMASAYTQRARRVACDEAMAGRVDIVGETKVAAGGLFEPLDQPGAAGSLTYGGRPTGDLVAGPAGVDTGGAEPKKSYSGPVTAFTSLLGGPAGVFDVDRPALDPKSPNCPR